MNRRAFVTGLPRRLVSHPAVAAAASGSGDRVMFRRASIHAVLALVVIVAAAGCSSANQLATSSTSPTSQRECGRTPGTAATWRPQLGYCEY
jgi:hypothetical protein